MVFYLVSLVWGINHIVKVSNLRHSFQDHTLYMYCSIQCNVHILSLSSQLCITQQEGYLLNWQLLWEGYPHQNMRLSLKFYMLNQVRTLQLHGGV